MGLPQRTEAAPFYFAYIDRISGENILETMKAQLYDAAAFLEGISEERSLFRYALCGLLAVSVTHYLASIRLSPLTPLKQTSIRWLIVPGSFGMYAKLPCRFSKISPLKPGCGEESPAGIP
jgi:hypothetical protein